MSISHLEVLVYVQDYARSVEHRLTLEEMREEDERDTAIVEADCKTFEQGLQPIVEQLEQFSGKIYHISHKPQHRRGIARAGGALVFSTALLRKKPVEIAQTIAHERAHVVLGHQASPERSRLARSKLTIPPEVMEQEADFYSGVFLGWMGYSLDEILSIKLRLPDDKGCHGPRVPRLYYLACGYYHGVNLRESVSAEPASKVVFDRDALDEVMPGVASKYRI